MILGIDAATTKSGWAILNTDGSLVSYGVFKTNSKEPLERIKEVYLFVKDILNKYNIKTIVAENVPITNKNNLKVGSDLLRLQGAIYALCMEYNIPMVLYNPSEWRSKIGTYNGTREGTKREFQKQKAIDIVNNIYNLKLVYFERETKKNQTDDDKAEAILIGLAFINDNKTERSTYASNCK